jgi:hypothetical protein
VGWPIISRDAERQFARLWSQDSPVSSSCARLAGDSCNDRGSILCAETIADSRPRGYSCSVRRGAIDIGWLRRRERWRRANYFFDSGHALRHIYVDRVWIGSERDAYGAAYSRRAMTRGATRGDPRVIFE